jgi:hypothetical protein
MNLTQNNITFLSDINKSYKIIKTAKYQYVNLGWNTELINFKFLIDNSFLDFLNNLTMKVNFIIEFIITSFTLFISFVPLLFHFIYGGLIIISIIYLASIWAKILDRATKVGTLSTGSTVLYNKGVKGESTGSGDDKDDNKKMKIKKMTVIKMKIKKIFKNLPNRMKPMKNNIKYLLSILFILINLNVKVNNTDPVITQLAYGVFLISLIALFCFINILGYIISYYLIQKGNYELRYPKMKRLINYFKGVKLIYLMIEGFLCLFCLMLLIVFSILFIIK